MNASRLSSSVIHHSPSITHSSSLSPYEYKELYSRERQCREAAEKEAVALRSIVLRILQRFLPPSLDYTKLLEDALCSTLAGDARVVDGAGGDARLHLENLASSQSHNGLSSSASSLPEDSHSLKRRVSALEQSLSQCRLSLKRKEEQIVWAEDSVRKHKQAALHEAETRRDAQRQVTSLTQLHQNLKEKINKMKRDEERRERLERQQREQVTCAGCVASTATLGLLELRILAAEGISTEISHKYQDVVIALNEKEKECEHWQRRLNKVLSLCHHCSITPSLADASMDAPSSPSPSHVSSNHNHTRKSSPTKKIKETIDIDPLLFGSEPSSFKEILMCLKKQNMKLLNFVYSRQVRRADELSLHRCLCQWRHWAVVKTLEREMDDHRLTATQCESVVEAMLDDVTLVFQHQQHQIGQLSSDLAGMKVENEMFQKVVEAEFDITSMLCLHSNNGIDSS